MKTPIAIISLSNIHRLLFLVYPPYVLCEVRNEYSYIMWTTDGLKTGFGMVIRIISPVLRELCPLSSVKIWLKRIEVGQTG